MVCYQTNCVGLQILLSTFPISQTKMMFTTPFLACLRPPRRCNLCIFRYPSRRQTSTILQRQRCWCHRSLSTQKSWGSAGSVGGYSVQASAPALSGEQSYVWLLCCTLQYSYRVLLTNHNLLLPACHPTTNNWGQRQDTTSRFDAKKQEPLRRLTFAFMKSPGTIVFLGTKNLWRVKAYKSRLCAMCWAVGSTIKTVLKVTLLSFTFAVPCHLYFIAHS